MKLAITEIAVFDGRRIQTIHKPSNHAVAPLYRQLGFKEIGMLDAGDTLFELAVA